MNISTLSQTPGFFSRVMAVPPVLQRCMIGLVTMMAMAQGVIGAVTNDTGYVSPQSYDSGTLWTTPNGAFTSNDTVVAAGGLGEQVVYGSFNFALPDDAIIVGIELKTLWNSSVNPKYVVLGADLSYDGGTSYTYPAYTNLASGTTPIISIFGGPQDKWTRSWTSEQLSTNQFRVRLTVTATDNGNPKANVDWLTARVYYTGVEPVVDNDGGATNVTATAATLQGRITAGTPPPVTTIYWGTNDGGNVVSAWSNSVVMGALESGTFSTSLTNLLANATYYYRCEASNYLGSVWAGTTTNFTTRKPAISFGSTSYVLSEDGSSQSVTVVLSDTSAIPVSVNYYTVDGTASNSSDYVLTQGSLTWGANETGSKTFSVPITDDGVGESDETFDVMLSNAVDCVIATSNATVVILDNDGTSKIRFSTPESAGKENITSPQLQLTLSPTNSVDVTVSYAVIGGTASNGVDYTLVSGVATVTAGQASAYISVTVSNDTLTEPDETIIVALSVPSNAVLGIYTNHTYTIQNDDQNPPAINNAIGAGAISASNAVLRGEVTFAGVANPEVTVYWGPNDGGTNLSAVWSNTVHLGVVGVGSFSTNISGLVSNATYYYRCFASNSDGAVWAPYSEHFVANNPPQFNLLSNEGFEDPSQKNKPAVYWGLSDANVARMDINPKSGTFSMQYSASGSSIYGTNNNAFRVSWNGVYAEAGVNVNGGVRPGFVLSGTAYTRAQYTTDTAASFTNRWRNVDAASDWMTAVLTTNSVNYEPIFVSNTNPVPVSHIGNRCRPELIRAGGTSSKYADDVSVIVHGPKMELEIAPTNGVFFGQIATNAVASTNVGVRNIGASGTILYGAYLADDSQVTNASRDETAWYEYSDPSNAFAFATGTTTLSATNDTGYQFVTIQFTPPGIGTYTGVVRVATTDPVDRYSGGGKNQSTIVYEEYTLVGVGVAPARLALTTNEMAFSAFLGSTPSSLSFGVTNSGGITLTYSNVISGTNWPWLTVSPSGATLSPNVVQVHTVTPGRATQVGTFTATNTLNGNQDNGPQTVVVHYDVLSIANPTNLTATRNVVDPATKLDLSWTTNSQGHDVMIIRSLDNTFFVPVANTSYSSNYTAGNDTVIFNGNGTSCTDSGLSPGLNYYYKFFSVNSNYYSSGDTVSTNTYAPHSRLVVNTPSLAFSSTLGSSASSQAFSVTNTGDDTLVYTNTVTYGTAWAWMTVTPSNMSLATNAVQTHTVIPGQATNTGTFYATNTLSGNQDNGAQIVVAQYTVAAIDNPSGISIVQSGVDPLSQLDLGWTRNAALNNVMITRSQLAAPFSPTQGVSYAQNAVIGSYTVVYTGGNTNVSDTGLQPSTTYYYTFFSVNADYYSSGVQTNLATGGIQGTVYSFR